MTDVAPTTTSSVCGVDLVIPSQGWKPSIGHFNEIEQAAADVSDEDFYESRRDIRVMILVNSDELSKEDLQYYERVLTILAAEWMKRIWGGSPEEVGERYADNLTLEEIALLIKELREEQEEHDQLMQYLPCEEKPVKAYHDRLEHTCEQKQNELTTSIKVNETANKQKNSDTTSESKGCGAKARKKKPEGPVEVDVEVLEPKRRKKRKKRQRELIDEQDEFVDQHPEVAPPRDRMQCVSCGNNDNKEDNCDGYTVKNKTWYCDELVTSIRKPRDDPEYWSSTEYDEIWYGGGQLGYAAWANSITITVKALENGLSAGAKCTATTLATTTGWIGVGLGTIDLGICAARWGKTHSRIKDLDKLFRKHFTENPSDQKKQQRITEYARSKKYDKETRAILATYFAAIGVIGGILGGIAFIASNPVGWAIALGFGIAAVLGGLGFITWKIINKLKKTLLAKHERNRLIECYRKRKDPNRTQASLIIRAIDGNRGTVDKDGYYEVAGNDPDDDKVLTKLLKKFTRMRRKTERQAMASAIIGFFLKEIGEFVDEQARTRDVDEQPEIHEVDETGGSFEEEEPPEPTQQEIEEVLSNSFGGSILAALNMKPLEMHRKFIQKMEKDKKKGTHTETQKLAGKWVEKVMSKLKSW